ncbi:DUF4912 domain-containing protein [Heliobacterium chlorum]|uniref:DUF4912 domain-containing protein n=1 Tax=Heliobacterium chlorum TaxID=2698 RepID=A0ABR7SXF3_HELCL|nr:DUF4912 domain-containing protein [Heliobacterium chlorum]MBC9783239.1 DUF4912 domain-containing protein [Heliobacterium chlorum]
MTKSLPQGYGEDGIGLLVQDPHHIFIYWELTEKTRQKALHNWSLPFDTPCLLRVQQEDKQGKGSCWNSIYQAELPPSAHRWYVSGLRPGKVYRAQIGLHNGQGEFIAVLGSKGVLTPPVQPVGPWNTGRPVAVCGGAEPIELEDLPPAESISSTCFYEKSAGGSSR